MDSFIERISKLSPKRLILLAAELQSKLQAAESAQPEPVAVIGIGLSFPGGATDSQSFWAFLRRGGDAIRPIPAERWDIDALYDSDTETPGKMSTRWGGFVDGIDRFEPAFFGITPREANTMDPQQRMVLEVCWEALENAGYAPDGLSGSRTGVFVGACNGDYYQMLLETADEHMDMYTSSGNAHSVISGRVSYLLGLHGPSLTVDTACSSSLVAMHLAYLSLRTGECRMALAGGVNAILSPETTIALSKAKMMAPDGRCKAFAASADGFVRSEGCGMVLLKRLSDAQADGDNILAVIRGSAMNQDGRSNGLTAPNGPSQVTVVRQALAEAGVGPAEVGYVEAHGTGTALGDPIEIQALGEAMGRDRMASRPLLVGSVKTNLGHLESAAGVAGLIKLILSLQNRYIPPHLHLDQLNPYIPWGELPVVVPTDGAVWEPINGRWIGGVSSFGFSGTNVHMIVEAAPERPVSSATAETPAERPLHLLRLSARSATALDAQARNLGRYLDENSEAGLADIAYTANAGRASFTHRLALTATSVQEARQKLAAYLQDPHSEQVVSRVASSNRKPELAFLFSGQGAQYVDMGRQLYETHPLFREVLDQCDDLFRAYLPVSLLDTLYAPPGTPPRRLEEMSYQQATLFAIEHALAQLWCSWGIEPGAVMGHSLGEYAAACLAGVFSLEDAVKLVATRARLLAAIPQTGAMYAVFAGEAQVSQVIAPYAHQVSIAAINGPESVVISGVVEAVEAVTRELKKINVRARRLAVAQGSHSPLVESVLDEFEQVAATVHYSEPHLPLISCLNGRAVNAGEITHAAYWRQHLRQPVRFAAAMNALYALNHDVFVEIGPNPVLLAMGQRCLPDGYGLWASSLREGKEDWSQLLDSLCDLYTYGVEVDWAAFDRPYPRRRVALPTYPFERQRYWFTTDGKKSVRRPHLAATDGIHPLLGQRLRSPALQDIVFETQLGRHVPHFLDHHHIFGEVILPSPAYLEMVLGAASQAFPGSGCAVENFTIHTPLVLPEDGLQTVQLVMKQPAVAGRVGFQVLSLDEPQEAWKLHVSGDIVVLEGEAPHHEDGGFSVVPVQARCPDQVSGEAFYARVRDLGLEFGSHFRGIRQIWRCDGEALGLVQLPEDLSHEAHLYGFHPAYLDACFHLLGAALPDGNLESAYLLIGMERFRLFHAPGTELWNHTLLTSTQADASETFSGDIRLYDAAGRLVAEAQGLHLKRADREALLRAIRRRPDDWVYEVEWQEKPVAGVVPVARVETDRLALDRLPADLAPAIDRFSQDPEIAQYQEISPELDSLSAGYIQQALNDLGWRPAVGEQVSAGSLVEILSILPQHARLVGRWLEILGEEGILEPSGAAWLVRHDSTPSTRPTEALIASLADRYPAYAAMFDLIGRCGPRLAGVLRGEQDPLHLLFPNGSLEPLERLYGNDPFVRAFNKLIEQTVHKASNGRRPLRILEIGAGTGSTTSCLLPSLPSGTEYVFSDLSPLFLEHARQRFSAYPFVRYSLLDIEREPQTQGFPLHHYDLVLAANVMHATADLRQSLANARRLLVPGGLLVLLEGNRKQRWVDLTFGLTEGWWKFSDVGLRPDYPLLAPSAWTALLRQVGFVQEVALPEAQTASPLSGQTLLLAQAPQKQAAFIEQTAHTEQTAHSEAPKPGQWLIFTDEGGVGQHLADRLRERRCDCLLVSPGADLQVLAEDHWSVDPAQPAHFQAILNQVDSGSLRGVVFLWGLLQPANLSSSDLTLPALEEAGALHGGSLLHLVQALLGTGQTELPSLWVATQRAQSVTPEPAEPAIVQAPLWGLGRAVSLEHPDLWGGSIDLDDVGPAQAAEILLAEIWQPDGEDQVAWRSGRRYAARLVRGRMPAPHQGTLRGDGAYLVTGGLGGLGILVANWLAEQGAGHLVLLGRRGLPPREQWSALPETHDAYGQVRAVQAIEALGATVTVAAVDVSDSERMAELFSRFGAALPPLRGIMHAAAILDSRSVAELDLAAYQAMLRPKVLGTWVLHQLSSTLELDFFVLFSSTTALLGSRLLAHYAAANHFMDAFAHYRRKQGLPAMSINWGTWDVMRVASLEEQQRVAQFGLDQMPSEQALGLLGDFLAEPRRAQVAIASVDWNVLKPAYEAKRRRPFLEQVSRSSAARAQSGPSQAREAELPKQYLAARPKDRRNLLINHLRQAVANVVKASSPDAIDPHSGLFEMGMDSLMSVELKSRIEAAVAQSLPSTLIFNYPTIADLADFLESKLVGPTTPPSDETHPGDVPSSTGQSTMAEPMANTDDLSEDELANLLMQKLEQI